jgi:hypothetical protein
MKRRFTLWLIALVIIAVSGEMTARLDDWIFQEIPLLANPDRERDLLAMDVDGVPRGRPHGRFKKYKLNALGFRSPEMSAQKSENTLRVLVLGASESFGLYESEDHEYPALLRNHFKTPLPDGRTVEIVNVSMAAMALPILTEYWHNYLTRLHADVVVLYAAPQFYLDDEVPKGRSKRLPSADDVRDVIVPLDASQAPGLAFRSRLFERLRDSAKQSDLIKTLRVHYLLQRKMAGKDADWFFHDVPTDRLGRYRDDLETLAASIARSGARPVLATHAFKTPSPPEDRDLAELTAYRIFFPRAELAVMPALGVAARQATLELGAKHRWPVIDVSAELTARRDLFADPVHFNDAGSAAMAKILADQLPPLLSEPKEAR